MKFLFLFLGFYLWTAPVNVQEANPSNNINPKEVADRMCSCGQEHQLPLYATQYKEASDEVAKREAKSNITNAIRQVHICVDMPTILKEVRALPTNERAQFEDNVMHQLTENCNDVAVALQTLR